LTLIFILKKELVFFENGYFEAFKFSFKNIKNSPYIKLMQLLNHETDNWHR